MSLIDLFSVIRQNNSEEFQKIVSRLPADKLNGYLYGATPLFYCIECRREAFAMELLRNGSVDINLKSNNGTSCLMKSFDNELYKVAEILLKRYKKAYLNELLEDKETFLTNSIKNQNNLCSNMLIEAGVDVNLPNGLNEYPIELSLKSNKIDVLKSLIKTKQLNLNTLSNGFNPLLDACQNDQTEAALELIKAGADLNIQDNDQSWTPLMHSLSNTNETIAVALIDSKRCDINLVDVDGNTALHMVANMENDYLAKKLLDAGAIKDIENNENLTPLKIAKLNEDETMTALLNK